MHPVMLRYGFVTVYSYGAMLSLAFLLGILLAMYLAKREGIDPEKVLDISLWLIISAIAGARVLYVMLFWNEFAGSPIEILMIQHGGLIFYGGLAAALLVLLWRAKAAGLSLWKIFDLASPSAALGYSVARIGCFLNGCCYGIETRVPWAVKFPALPGMRHPTELYSSASAFAIFLIVIALWRRRKFEGQIFLQTVVLYTIYRFFVEFLRTEPRYFYLSSAQWISIVAFPIALGALIWKLRKIK